MSDAPAAPALGMQAGRVVLIAASVAYAIQVGLVLAVLIGLATGTPGIGLTASGARSAVVGLAPVLRIEAWRGYGEPYTGPLAVSVVAAEGEQACVNGGGGGWFCTLDAPRAPGPYAATIRATLGDEPETIELVVLLDARAPRSGVLQRAELAGVAAPRGRSVADPRGEPALTVVEADVCGRSVAAWPESGIPVANVEQRVWLRVQDAERVPVTRATVACVGDRGPLAPVTTDELGTAVLTLRPEWEERVRCTVPCADGSTQTATLHVVPSWDGLLLAPAQASVAPGQPARVVVSHQREGGQWIAGLWCDGVRVWGATVPIRPGRGLLDVAIPPLSVDALQTCVLQASTSPRGTPASRSAHRVLLRPPNLDERNAVISLAHAVAAMGGAQASWVGDVTRGLLPAASDAAITRLGLATLSSLPQPWIAEELAADGVAVAAADDTARRGALRTQALVVLAVDGGLLLLVVFGLWLPVWSQQRHALRTELADAEDADGGDGVVGARSPLAQVSGVRELVPLLVFAFGSAVMFIVGLVTLLSAID